MSVKAFCNCLIWNACTLRSHQCSAGSYFVGYITQQMTNPGSYWGGGVSHRKGGDSRVCVCTRLKYRVMPIWKNRDFSCTYWIIQIYFSDSGSFLCVNAYFRAYQYIFFYFLFQIMVNKKHGKQNQKKCGIYKRNFLYAQLKFVGLK